MTDLINPVESSTLTFLAVVDDRRMLARWSHYTLDLVEQRGPVRLGDAGQAVGAVGTGPFHLNSRR